MPRRKFPTLYPPGLPFGLLRRLELSKGTGHGAGGQLRLPSHTAQAQAVLLLGEVTFILTWTLWWVLSSKLAAELWNGESWKIKCPWLFICPHGSYPCYQHRAAVGHARVGGAVVGDAQGSA